MNQQNGQRHRDEEERRASTSLKILMDISPSKNQTMAELRAKYKSGVSLPIGSPGETVMSLPLPERDGRKESRIKIGTWNVKTMAKPGKIYNATKEMRRLKVHIMGISEMRWPGTGVMDIDEHKVYYSGTQNDTHEYGVGFIVHKSFSQKIKNFIPVSERIIVIQIEAKPVNINLIQIYAPTFDHPDSEVEELYDNIAQIQEKIPKHEITILMGDFNAKLGKGNKTDYIGSQGLGDRNERGDMLENFIEHQEMVALNTFFQQPPRRLYTWRSPQDRPEKVVRNQIDFILINKRYRNCCTSMRTYPGADINSDHVPVIGEFRAKMKTTKRKTQKRCNMRLMKEPKIREEVSHILNEKMENVEENAPIEEQLEFINEMIQNIKDEYLKEDVSREKKKTWMTDNILNLMEERRMNKGNTIEYRRLNNQIRKEIREAKEKEKTQNCLEIEAYQRMYDDFNVHRKVKEVTGRFKRRQYGKLLDKDGKIIIEQQEKKERWMQYVEELFEDDRGMMDEITGDSGPSIMENEVEIAIKQMKEGKAAGPDNLEIEFMKLLNETGVKKLTKMYNKIYETGILPQPWLTSEFITLPKSTGAKRCEEYRTISLMSHLLKLFLKIIHRRIYKLCEEQIAPNQFGFLNAVGTREALFSVQVLIQRSRDVNSNVFACLIDYKKAFDRVKHEMMVEILKQIGTDARTINIITNLYWNQTAVLKIDGEHTDEVQILRGVRQGCVLSPILFNLYSEHIFREALNDMEEGIPINGIRLNNLRYADDTIMLADTIEGLQKLMTKIAEVSSSYGLDINASKTKLMIISKEQISSDAQIIVNQVRIERVTQCQYLGTCINEAWDNSQEVKCRIAKARNVFNSMDSVFKSHNLTLDTKTRLLKCYVFSVLLYGVETWTLTEAITNKLRAFELWLYRRMLRISWIQKITNAEVLRRMNKEAGRKILRDEKCKSLLY
uniref:Craniofacial development protein 2 n=1 Tax=Cacopsylla melanoneura TaxID=428564 RepID=A0A8D8RKC5_9HEMI